MEQQDPVETIVVLIGFGLLLALYIGVKAGVWLAFDKAREPGWACLIPVYNYYATLKIGGMSGWWLLIPLINLFAIIYASFKVASYFGRSDAFGIGLAFLPFIFWPILGYGKATYAGPRRFD